MNLCWLHLLADILRLKMATFMEKRLGRWVLNSTSNLNKRSMQDLGP